MLKSKQGNITVSVIERKLQKFYGRIRANLNGTGLKDDLILEFGRMY
jgi:hypothetical protein